MPKTVRVDRSAFVLVCFFFAKEHFVGKIGGKIRFAKIEKMVKNCESSVFRVFCVKKNNKKRKARVGAIS